MIRKATLEDLGEITRIYNQAIETQSCTGDTAPFTARQRRGWFDELAENERTPIYVFDLNGIVIGYCYLSAYRKGRQALMRTAEISFFIDYEYHKKGVGSAMLSHAITQAKLLGYETLIAIVMGCNEGSVSLLEKYGFGKWGELPGVVRFGEKIYAHLYYGRSL